MQRAQHEGIGGSSQDTAETEQAQKSEAGNQQEQQEQPQQQQQQQESSVISEGQQKGDACEGAPAVKEASTVVPGASRHRQLFLVSAYNIGKEKIVFEVGV